MERLWAGWRSAYLEDLDAPADPSGVTTRPEPIEGSLFERILASGVLRVGMDASYPPFETENADGTCAGYDVDLARALAARWGVRAEFVNVHLDGLYDALRAGKCDVIISAIPYDRTMTRDVLYSTAYLNAGLVLVVREGWAASTAATGRPQAAIDTAIVGVVDRIDLASRIVYLALSHFPNDIRSRQSVTTVSLIIALFTLDNRRCRRVITICHCNRQVSRTGRR